jgi:hypothetical protein
MHLDWLPGSPHLTYCTNIHAGETWPDIAASIEAHLPAIKAAVSPDRPFGLGLRLSGIAADALAEPPALAAFRSFLREAGSYVFTLNAFPYGPFHGERVKEAVYQPDWTRDERLRFTNRAADILAALLPEGMEGSISTVPGTFKPLAAAPGAVEAIAARLVDHAAHLVRIEAETGRRIALAIEPEPFCLLETVGECIAFFETHLLGAAARRRLAAATGLAPAAAEAALRRHLGLCYDVCHAAVEFEEAAGSLRALAEAGIAIPKLQVSAAIRVPEVGRGTEALLRPFDEGVYLHQVVERRDGRLTRHRDLPDAFAALREGRAGGEWRVHCHVPVFLDRLDGLATTQDFLREILALCRAGVVAPHFEVETYTWDVLPREHAGEDKARAIARELAWTLEALS